MARVFSAVNITDPEILDRLEKLRNTLDFGFKPVKPSKMHLTLQFFSNINEAEIQKVKNAMDSIELNSFNVKIKGVGAFPSKDYIRVLWVGAEAEELYRLKEQVSNHSIPENNDHDFHPHITLLRVEDISREEKNKLRRVLKDFEGEELGEIEVNSVNLFETVLGPKGSEYKKIYESEL